MPLRTLPVQVLIRHLECGLVLAEPLLCPELSRLATDSDRGRDRLMGDVAYSLESLFELETPFLLHRRLPPETLAVGRVEVTLPPPERAAAWRKSAWQAPLELHLPVVRWTAADGTLLAFVPHLGIEVPARSEAELGERLLDDVRGELMRRQSITLLDLFKLSRPEAIEPVELQLRVDIKSPLQRQAQKPRQESILGKVATDLRLQPLPPAWEVDALVRSLADLLSARVPRSVLLVGPSGVGKTALVHELVRRSTELGMAATPFFETSGPRLMAGAGGFGMWQERCDRVRQEVAAARAVLLLGNLLALGESGKIGNDAMGVADFFRPAIERGDIIAIAECTPQQHDLLERDNPTLLGAFHVLRVPEPTPLAVRSILLSAAVERELDIEPDDLELIYRLHARYATYSAMPGRPLRFLRHLSGPTDDVAAIFSRETGLPRWLIDDAVKLDLATCEQWFSARILGQPAAISLVTDLLAQLKAGLSRPSRPLASFLFIGPTGVGKTEMSKALAEYMFADRERITRFDMSEYADPVSVRRLVGGGADGAGLLTGAVREQPFSVLLFDEVEKAHPDFFDLLLQLLGEARLTDAAGRLADCRNCIVIMTSNAGATEFRRGTLGFVSRRDADRAVTHFTKAVRQMFRPELFNRLDRVVPFSPLTRGDALAITRRELELLWRRDGLLFRPVELQCQDGAAAELAREGFDPRYGARPLKRAIERRLLAPMAEGLNRYASEMPLRVRISGDLSVRVEPIRSKAVHADEGFKPSAALARLAPLRRQAHLMMASSATTKLQNDVHQLKLLADKVAKMKRPPPEMLQNVAKLPLLQALYERLRTTRDQLDALETQALLETPPTEGDVDAAEQMFEAALLDLFASRFEQAHRVTLAFFGTAHARVRSLFETYVTHMRAQGLEVVLSSLHLYSGKELDQMKAECVRLATEGKTPGEALDRILADLETRKPWQWSKRQFLTLDDIPAEYLGLVIQCQGRNAFAWYGGEEGVHVFEREQATERVLVAATPLPLQVWCPPPEMARRPALGALPKRRTYLWKQGHIDDRRLERYLSWQSRDVSQGLQIALRACLLEAARAAVIGAP
jgi:ATP-dependent Clp protease ATP-binding subunit ClpA